MNVAIYTRVSTNEQAMNGISLDAQEKRCRDLCQFKDWSVTEVYCDAGFSAGNTDRPAFKRLFQDAKSHKFENIIVYKIDRFSRNLKDLVNIMSDLKKENINFTSITEQIDTTTAMGEAFFQIIGVFAQLERGMIKERVEMAFKRKVEKGNSVSRPPFGYKYSNKELVIDRTDMIRVQDIFSLKKEGLSHREIARQTSIPKSSVSDILKNPVYIGKLKYKDKIVSGNHVRIISDEDFYSINKKEAMSE